MTQAVNRLTAHVNAVETAMGGVPWWMTSTPSTTRKP
jgi:hypothetical protein